MKLCIDCKHLRAPVYAPLKFGTCTLNVQYTSPVTGDTTYFPASKTRELESLCGISAKWFDPKP